MIIDQEAELAAAVLLPLDPAEDDPDDEEPDDEEPDDEEPDDEEPEGDPEEDDDPEEPDDEEEPDEDEELSVADDSDFAGLLVAPPAVVSEPDARESVR
ncbi:hypothetical protein [Micromonospora tarensis]|uniref:hypothetical protein n=1 Tax=Micromonospora tarensis TaxID=2806100 RepID=UPI001EE4C01D|nr:hypothetical protein [Micromonospora tarensis]